MIVALFEQAGLSARIDGEYLLGGVGELQAFGLVRVMIEESDYPEARKIIQEWEAKQPAEVDKPQVKKKSTFGSALLGFIFGVGIMIAYYHTPITNDGIDYNGDGKLDEKWTYINYRNSKTELDRNFDGNIDFIYLFDRKGLVKSSSSDDDFNGTFETDVYFRRGNAIWQKVDTNGDGLKDYRIDFKDGVLDKISFLDPFTGKAIKLQKYSPFTLVSAEVDTTGDGVMDTFYEYDSIEEITNKSNKAPTAD
jgi:hypothetical protein